MILSLLITLLIPRFLGPSLFGLYTLVVIWIGFLIPISSLGIGSGIIYYLSSGSYQFSSVFTSNVWIAAIIGLFNMVLLSVFYYAGICNHFDPGINPQTLILLLCGAFFQSVNFIVGRALLGDSKFNVMNVMDILNILLNPVILMICILILPLDNSWFVYVAFALTHFFLTVCLIYTLRSQIKWNTINRDYIKACYHYGIQSWIGDIALKANLRLDQILLGSFSSLNVLGIYTVAVKLIELVWIIPDTLGPVLFNSIAALDEPKTKLHLLLKLHRLVFICCFIFIILWLIVCKFWIIPYITGTEYSSAFTYMLLLAPGILIFISSKIITKLYSASGEVHWTSKITIFGSIISVVCYLLLIPPYGPYGAAIASSIGYISISLAGIYLMHKHYQIQPSEYYNLQKSDLFWFRQRFHNLLNRKSN
jgi:O-antigen/teichoic acid export membrane protein